MDAEKYVNQYGGKAGGWFYLKDTGGFEKHLLPLVYLARDHDISEALRQFPEEFPRQIVRGTHPNDYEGLVDALKTHKDVKNQFDLEFAIEQIREHAQSEAVRSYNEYEGQEYGGNVAIMIQPQNPSLKRGSLVEHPHERGTYLIDFVDESYEIPTIDRAVASGDSIDASRMMRPPADKTVQSIIQLYKRIREGGFIPDSHSFQMEFGLNYRFDDKEEVLFYQARPFLKFEDATFRLNKRFEEYDCFGITPEDGLVLDVVRTWNGEDVNDIEHPFAMIVDNMSHPIPLEVQPRNLEAFLPIGQRVNSLEHHTYRWMRKSRVSLLSHLNEFELAGVKTGDKLKIICDGLNYDVQKVA
ncbi:MAG: hypothetical protein ABH840_03535 [Nanoarchaeota archaeon]